MEAKATKGTEFSFDGLTAEQVVKGDTYRNARARALVKHGLAEEVKATAIEEMKKAAAGGKKAK